MTPAQSKARASADAKARALAKAANGTESQVNNSPPMVYQAPSINVPASMHEVAALIQGELTKIQQAQSVLLTLYEKFDPVPGGNGARITPEPTRPDAFFEYGSSSTQTYVDIHTPGEVKNADYGARLIAEAVNTNLTNYARVTLQGYAVNLVSTGNAIDIAGAVTIRPQGGSNNPRLAWEEKTTGKEIACHVWNSESTSRGLTMEWATDYGNGGYMMYLEKNKATNTAKLSVNGAIAASLTVTATGEVITTSQNSYRHVAGQYGQFWRQDGNDLYLMLTNAGDQYGSYNGLRPFIVDLPTGKCTIKGTISSTFEQLYTEDGAQYLTDRHADTREALLKEEIKQEIYAELMAAGVISELPAPLPQEVGAHE